MTVEINNKKIELKYGFRSLMLYENIATESFQPTSIVNIINFFYACILAQTFKDEPIDYEYFLDWLDEHPAKLEEFSEWLLSILKTNGSIKGEENKENTDSKEQPKN